MARVSSLLERSPLSPSKLGHSRAMAPYVIIGERAAEIWRQKHTRDLALRPVSRRARQKARARLRMKLGARGVLALLPPD